MKFAYEYLIIAFCAFCLSYASSKNNTEQANALAATALKPYGRFTINQAQSLELISSAVRFGSSFEGNTCQLFASIPNKNGHNYLQYELDGVYQKKIKISGNSF